MCYLYAKTSSRKVVGYKVVALKRNAKRKLYYSIAMGFCYNRHKKIPIVNKQKRIDYFNSDILTSGVFSKEMEGRTAIFISLEDGTCMLSAIKLDWRRRDYYPVLVRAEVSGSLLKGEYGKSTYVVGGRKIKFLEEVIID